MSAAFSFFGMRTAELIGVHLTGDARHEYFVDMGIYFDTALPDSGDDTMLKGILVQELSDFITGTGETYAMLPGGVLYMRKDAIENIREDSGKWSGPYYCEI